MNILLTCKINIVYDILTCIDFIFLYFKYVCHCCLQSMFLYIFFQTQSTKSIKKTVHIKIIRNAHQIAAGKIQKKKIQLKITCHHYMFTFFWSKKDKKKQHGTYIKKLCPLVF